MRFYLDENLSPRIAEIGRRQGLDITSWQEFGFAGRADVEHLEFAAAEGRCLVTQDYRDFRALNRQWKVAGRSHAGILYLKANFPVTNFRSVATALTRYDREHPDGPEPYAVSRLVRPDR